MFEITYYNIATRKAVTSPTTEIVDAVEVLKYLEKAKEKQIIIVSLVLEGKYLNAGLLCTSLKFK